MAGIDPHVEAAVSHLVTSDPEFQKMVKQVAALALKTQLHFLKHGTPDVQVAISRAFIPIFTKALTGNDGNKPTEDLHAEIRAMFQQQIPPTDP